MGRLLPLGRRGLPTPVLITPLTDEEATSGVATFIAAGDLPEVIRGLRRIKSRPELIDKFERLLGASVH